mmetsp:Transcript_16352/g.29374  ORF Transcript_16352/g.29374 Transcript_16352/m.29374 type:complete len:104 (-) Transcript_16352:340-651(-)
MMRGVLKFPNAIYKLVRPGKQLAPNEVLFHVPLWHNKIQIKNYLEEIYNVKVARVDTTIQAGKEKLYRTKRFPSGIRKRDPDIKKAYVTLEDTTFKFPDIFGT